MGFFDKIFGNKKHEENKKTSKANIKPSNKGNNKSSNKGNLNKEFDYNASKEKKVEMIKTISDDNLLSKIAYKESHLWVFSNAIERIKTESILADIARNHPKPEARAEAVENPHLRDNYILEDIALNESELNVYSRAIDKIINETILKNIAKNASQPFARSYAIRNPNLHDDSVLEDIALNDPDDQPRKEAVIRIYNQSILNEIGKNDSSATVRKEAIKKIRDDSVLEEIAINDSFSFNQEEAINNIKDKDILKNMINSSDSIVSNNAKKRLAKLDPKYIKTMERWDEIKKDLPKSFIEREEEVNKITDVEKLTYIAKYDDAPVVSLAAVKKINDEKILKDIFENNKSELIYSYLLKKFNKLDVDAKKVTVGEINEITDELTLEYIINAPCDTDIRLAGVDRLNQMGYSVGSNVKYPSSKFSGIRVIVDKENKKIYRDTDKLF